MKWCVCMLVDAPLFQKIAAEKKLFGQILEIGSQMGGDSIITVPVNNPWY